MNNEDMEIAMRRLALEEMEEMIREYVEGYTLEGEDGASYTPSDTDRILIQDAIDGLIAEAEFVERFEQWRKVCQETREGRNDWFAVVIIAVVIVLIILFFVL